ncbi:alpha/beta hydrolase [Paenibacillus sp. MBLB4367]|uniref:alpha/beta hydrolase n=1 Tax=Paenibacillus sp. MBLB4367 TaxID=3384767 RepID=UPI003907F8BC
MFDNRHYSRTIVKESLSSSSLGKERPLTIYLPPGYNELLSYPVIYCQDGLEFFNFGRIATQTNYLIMEENLEPPIIVGVEVDKELRSEEYDPTGSRFEAYCTFFAEELLAHVENRYPVRQTPDERLVAGDSLGGTVSLHLALNYPQLFRKVIAFSGAFYEATQRRIEEAGDLSELDIYMIVGLQETAVEVSRGFYDFLQANRSAARLLTERGAHVHYEEKDGKHLWGFWQNELPSALRLFLG